MWRPTFGDNQEDILTPILRGSPCGHFILKKCPNAAGGDPISPTWKESAHEHDQPSLSREANLVASFFDGSKNRLSHFIRGHPPHVVHRHSGFLFQHILRKIGL